jgi:antitoxin component YwqK of YwqJK toxin-antitoxin module
MKRKGLFDNKITNKKNKMEDNIKKYMDNSLYVYILSADKDLVILQRTEDTITDEDRDGIIDETKAMYSANILKIVDIIDMDTNEHMNSSFDKKQKEYIVGELIKSNYDRDLTFYKNIFMVLNRKKPGKDFVGRRIGWNYDGKENLEENYTCVNGNQYVYCKYTHDKGIIREYNKCNDKLHGLFIKYDNNGIKNMESNYIDGKLSGSLIRWHNGKLFSITDYIDGKACFSEKCREDGYGKDLEFYKNGNAFIVNNYKGGKKHGEHLIYAETGHLYEKGQYCNGEKIGEWKFWWHLENIDFKIKEWAEVKDGLQQICYYTNDLLDGKFISYNSYGLRNKECFYVKGQLHGKYIEWSDKYDGTMYKRIECNYDNGKLQGKYIERYYDGNIKEECNYVNGVKDGKWIKYEYNGNYKECICINGVENEWIEHKTITNSIFSALASIFY